MFTDIMQTNECKCLCFYVLRGFISSLISEKTLTFANLPQNTLIKDAQNE